MTTRSITVHDRRAENILRFNPYFAKQSIAPGLPLNFRFGTGLYHDIPMPPGADPLLAPHDPPQTAWIRLKWGYNGTDTGRNGSGGINTFTISGATLFTEDLAGYYLIDSAGNWFEIENNSGNILTVSGTPATTPTQNWAISSGADEYHIWVRYDDGHGLPLIEKYVSDARGNNRADQEVTIPNQPVGRPAGITMFARGGVDRSGDSAWTTALTVIVGIPSQALPDTTASNINLFRLGPNLILTMPTIPTNAVGMEVFRIHEPPGHAPATWAELEATTHIYRGPIGSVTIPAQTDTDGSVMYVGVRCYDVAGRVGAGAVLSENCTAITTTDNLPQGVNFHLVTVDEHNALNNLRSDVPILETNQHALDEVVSITPPSLSLTS